MYKKLKQLYFRLYEIELELNTPLTSKMIDANVYDYTESLRARKSEVTEQIVELIDKMVMQ